MNYEQLIQEISEIVQGDFHLQCGHGYQDTYSLRINGELICFEEPPERVLWAIAHPEEYQAQMDEEIAELLADLAGEES